ncbi:MAG: cysteine protease StiP family protein [Myxococcales bacterium]|nr:cysteine protease StiP family protein [Myxococcales bacterium]
MQRGFSGSYDPDDVRFLLEPIELPPTDVETKERLIQSGAVHYSEVLAPEEAPDATYLGLFEDSVARNGGRVARDVAALAKALAEGPPTALVSLARAGTPVGVLLRRALRRLGVEAPHYAVSIIRDRGIDARALDAVRAWHPDRRLAFVDGWTGKGAIARELRSALADYDAARGTRTPPFLVVLSDLAGVAELAAGGDDYLIPSAILNGTVSGLLSRTVLDTTRLGPDDFHGCVELRHLAPHDRTRAYVDTIDGLVGAAIDDAAPARWGDADRAACAERTRRLMADLAARHGVTDLHRIKPGIGEATRAVLRRMPDRVLVADPAATESAHLVHLAAQRGARVEVWPALPYAAVTLIRKLGAAHAPWRAPE